VEWVREHGGRTAHPVNDHLSPHFLAPVPPKGLNRRAGPNRPRAAAKETDRMDTLHQMLVEDEILFCGLVVVVGAVTGAVARLVASLRERRVA
jgi:hypothetical protein